MMFHAQCALCPIKVNFHGFFELMHTLHWEIELIAMMSEYNHRLQSVKSSYDNGDTQLGLRRLIDLVTDTGQLDLFKQMLRFIESTESESVDADSGLNPLLDALSAFQQPSAKTAGKVLVEVDDVSKTYRNSMFTIGPLNFSVKYGEVTGLVGENGNGKTTLLRLLCKELEPDTGTIRYAAESECKSLYELRSRFIYVPQRVPRWFGSLMDNLYFTLSSYGIHGDENLLRAELMLARLGLRPFREHGWNRISSGYRTRFELAKSLLRKPELMLLDEPLSNLDIISQQTILRDLKDMSTSVVHPFGLVLSSQQLYEVEKISDLVVFLKQGSPKYSQKENPDSDLPELVFEMDAKLERAELEAFFKEAGMSQMHYNGGVFVMHFNPGSKSSDVFSVISKHNLPVTYIRNISNSTRRFFIQ